jgi:hypothetical protein
MGWGLTDLRGEQAQRGGRTGRRGVACVLRELAAYKRSSAWVPLVSVPTASAHLCGGCSSRPGALFQTSGVVGSPWRRSEASIVHNSRGLKGVMEE